MNHNLLLHWWRMLVCALVALVASNAMAQGYQVITWPAAQRAPEFAVSDMSGHVWHLRDLKGRAVLINFWASWCEPCLNEMPSLQTVAELYGPEKLVVLAVNFKQSRPTIDNFVKKTALQLPVLPDPQGLVARQWGVKAFPTTVLVAADGKVRAVVQGEVDWTGQPASRLLQALF
ncbi:MAG: TlpA disulfide reductase family protein [Rhodoferax sp.]|uniref:TlpA family protein disulfide reductase n=1 Tax=Rhodoferax sp. TaxID=50421 RepID=UPI00262DA084|nr:TlpA disulfide reductase family protein [Rhodoferax sp.]MDD2882903.1 TlpA disulfide reductase family protein [Rhodoferax sp.]